MIRASGKKSRQQEERDRKIEDGPYPQGSKKRGKRDRQRSIAEEKGTGEHGVSTSNGARSRGERVQRATRGKCEVIANQREPEGTTERPAATEEVPQHRGGKAAYTPRSRDKCRTEAVLTFGRRT